MHFFFKQFPAIFLKSSGRINLHSFALGILRAIFLLLMIPFFYIAEPKTPETKSLNSQKELFSSSVANYLARNDLFINACGKISCAG